MCLWQVLYRSIATQSWRFPTRSSLDASTWCTRCSLEVKENIIHCLWACPISLPCWRWGEELLRTASASHTHHRSLSPIHIFLAVALPAEWGVPEKLWHTVRAVLIWQIWKDRNSHYMTGWPSTVQRITRKSWHRLSVYLRKEWQYLVSKVKKGLISNTEAERLMPSQFGSSTAIWNIHGIVLQVPP